ncbi:MAG: hypothetical protein ACLFRV_04270 [Acidimicrobiales bacterium]
MRTDELVRSLEVRAQRGNVVPAELAVATSAEVAARRHRVRRATVGSLAVVVVLVVGVIGWRGPEWFDGAVRVEAPAGPGGEDSEGSLERPVVDEERRAELTSSVLENLEVVNRIGLFVPDGWTVTGENLTPDVSPPVVAAVGTGPLPAGGAEGCPHLPIESVLAMDADDVLVALVEDGSIQSPEQAESLWDTRADADHSVAADCDEWPAGVDAWRTEFAAEGRGVSLLAVAGPDVSAERWTELAVVVDHIWVQHPALSTLGPPPVELPMTGLLGHPVTVDGRDYLVGVEHKEAGGMRLEVADIELDESVLSGSSSAGAIPGTTYSSGGLVAGWAPEGTETVELVMRGETLATRPVTVESAPDLPVWIVRLPSERTADMAVSSPRFLDEDGNEIDPSG